MKIRVLQENLKTALNYLQKAIPTKPQLPILSSILITATENTLILSATDLYFGVTCICEAAIERDGTIAVPGDIFKQIVSSLSPGDINLELNETNLLVKSGSSTTKLPIQSGKDFPQFPEVIGREISFTLEEINAIERNVSFAVSIDQTRPVLTSLCFIFNAGELEVAATDGFRLAVLKMSTLTQKEPWKMLVPSKAIAEAVRIANQVKAERITFAVSEELKQVKITIENTQLFVRLIEGEYPPYEKIIPATYETEVLLDAGELLTQLKRSTLFSRDSSNIVHLTLSGEELGIFAKSASYGEYSGKIPVDKKIEVPVTISFNTNYLVDFITNTKVETLQFSLNESLRPAQFGVLGVSSYRYIVMPFRANEAT